MPTPTSAKSATEMAMRRVRALTVRLVEPLSVIM
jgi:hypothetical protein